MRLLCPIEKLEQLLTLCKSEVEDGYDCTRTSPEDDNKNSS